MSAAREFAAVAALLGDPARATMCLALLDGRAHTAGELARVAGVAPSTASGHLAKLTARALLTVVVQGRHRYYRLAGAHVARAVEQLSVLAAAPEPVRSLRESRADAAMRYARTCYDHLAGQVGVELLDALVESGVLDSDLVVVDAAPMRALGVDHAKLRTDRRQLARACLDWTERRDHLAGALGAAVTERLFALGWIERIGTARAVRVTAIGRRGVQHVLHCELSPYRAA